MSPLESFEANLSLAADKNKICYISHSEKAAKIAGSLYCGGFYFKLSMMPNRSGDPLFQLIKSLQRGEKRIFKLYITRNSSNEDLKVIQLFDLIDKMTDYDEAGLFTKIPGLKKEQLSNRKSHLYKQILASLRLVESNNSIEVQLHEQLDHAKILYNKGLYHQSLKILDRAKETARLYHQQAILPQILLMEKKIEALHITRSLQDRARQLSVESDRATDQLLVTNRLSNLSLELYGWYINHGHARNEADELMLTRFFKSSLPANAPEQGDFYHRLYLYQSYCWYAFILQDFLMYYRYCQKWVNLFEEEPLMKEVETAHYIRGMHNLISAHFDLKNEEAFENTLQAFDEFGESAIVTKSENNTIQVFVYLYTALINRHFMNGSFGDGLVLVPFINEKLKEYSLYLDRHRVLVFYYKIASLHFGNGDFDETIDYLNKIINWKVDLRNDLQCYARLLNLIAHYELGNFNLLEYLVKSVYRFMAKMENLGPVEEDIFRFLQKAFSVGAHHLKPEFERLLERLKLYENKRFATRAFAYLDIVSWLESKINDVPVGEVIRRKAMKNKRRA